MRRGRIPSLGVQAFALRRRFPDAEVRLKPQRLVWTGRIQPTPLSRQYLVRVDYQSGWFPQVRVLDHLEFRDGESLPHVYREGTLCLHRAAEWTPDMLLVDTTLPWTAEWLINYEIWLATGDWHGGGEWPPPRGDTGPADDPEEDQGKSAVTRLSERRWSPEMEQRGRRERYA